LSEAYALEGKKHLVRKEGRGKNQTKSKEILLKKGKEHGRVWGEQIERKEGKSWKKGEKGSAEKAQKLLVCAM